jgi:hypothetical protein
MRALSAAMPLSIKTGTDLLSLARHFMKEPDYSKMILLRGVVALLLLWALGFSVPAHALGKQENSDAKADYLSTREDILRFEGVVNDVINSTFSSSSFAVVQKAKGAYLQGYGISFTFLINIHRAVVNTPFGQIRTKPMVTPEMKMQRIEELKEKLIQVLQNNGEMFQHLRKEDYVSIVGFFEDRNFPGELSTNKTIVLSALKKDLDELGHRNDRLREFKQRMKIVEY